MLDKVLVNPDRTSYNDAIGEAVRETHYQYSGLSGMDVNRLLHEFDLMQTSQSIFTVQGEVSRGSIPMVTVLCGVIDGDRHIRIIGDRVRSGRSYLTPFDPATYSGPPIIQVYHTLRELWMIRSNEVEACDILRKWLDSPSESYLLLIFADAWMSGDNTLSSEIRRIFLA